ncbi:MAG: hypothetical protein ACR2P1_01790 [Pseudomonadales bacterium]
MAIEINDMTVDLTDGDLSGVRGGYRVSEVFFENARLIGRKVEQLEKQKEMQEDMSGGDCQLGSGYALDGHVGYKCH